MSLRIQKEGMLTTVQGSGLYGLQRFGINPRGAMDRTAARLINVLLENDEDEPVIEMHFPAGEIIFEDAAVFALGGADFGALLNGEPVENWRCVDAERSAVLKFEKKILGSRCCLAIRGGLEIEIDRFRNLRLGKGERIGIITRSIDSQVVGNSRVSPSILPIYSSFPTVRIIPGGEFDFLSRTDQQALFQEDFAITNESNRMGFRLCGPALKPVRTTEMVSSAVTFGTIQLLPDGQLIVLMADHQTSGGYPRIANVISTDLPLLAQLGTGDKMAFSLVDIAQAERVTMQFEQDIQRLRIGCRFGRYW